MEVKYFYLKKKMKPRSKQIWFFLVLMVAAIPLRLFAFTANDLPHGDIHLDIAAARSFQEDGSLFIPIITHHSYLEPQMESGYYQDQHAPLWSMMGGFLNINGDIYGSLKLLSLLSGILLIPLSFLAVRRALDESTAWLVALFVSISYILIDYSGNGSLYILHAMFFMLIILVVKTGQGWRSALSGLLVGLAYLLNYQAVVAFCAVGCVYLLRLWQAANRRKILFNLAIFLLVSLLTVLPWLVRNFTLFGSPFFSANFDYVLGNLGLTAEIQLVDEQLLRVWTGQDLTWTQMVATALGWIFRNAGYFVLRILVLAPVITFFIPFGLKNWFLSLHYDDDQDASLVYGLLLVLHLALSIAWPSFKFRYFVPILPLWFGLGAIGLVSLFKGTRWFYPTVTCSLVCFLGVSWITYNSVSSHTNYYDSNEFYHYRTGEAEWQVEERNLCELAKYLKNQPKQIIIGPLQAHTYSGYTVININSLQDPGIALHFIEKYQIRWILDEASKLEFYKELLEVQVIRENNDFILLKVVDSH